MPDLADGESIEVQGSARKPYELKNTGGVYSCTCPAWRHQSRPIEQRTCKHLRKLRGEEAELSRVGDPPPRSPRQAADGEADKPPLLLAHRWEDQDLTGWWMSEKLDGVRAYWNGKEFVSRLGNRYLAPAWFTAGLPEHPLDGELWVGRKQFQKTVSIVRRGDRSKAWASVRYLVFDAPGREGAFEARLEWVEGHITQLDSEFVEPVAHERCEGVEHLQEELARVESLGGEGLMLRQPGSRYVSGRSATLLKVKTFFDAEAKVVGHTPGRGRHEGRTGSLVVVMPGGVQFSVGTGLSDKQREDPPEVGAVITYRYQELSDGGVPRFPSFVGVRDDADWEEQEAEAEPVKKKKKKKKEPQSSQRSQRQTAEAEKNEKKKKKKKKKTEKKTTEKKGRGKGRGRGKGEKRSATPPPEGAGERRYFEMVRGSSNKFWAITVRGQSHTVHYGRIGTQGQTRTKVFPDAAAAEKDAQKLIRQKTGKGYEETSDPSSS